MSDTMKAARVVEPGRIEVVDAPIPDPGDGQVRVRHEGCGVCASNLPPFEGREWFTYPMDPGNLGHEAWGVVDAVGPGVTRFKPGDRVATLGQKGYAEYDVADAAMTVPLPGELAGRAFPAEPLGCAVNILGRSAIRPGDTVAIVGVGFLGALLTRLVTNAGGRVLAVARRQTALDVARQFGAAECIEIADRWGPVEAVKAATGGAGADVVIECVGKQEALDLSTDLVREMGRLVLAGYHQDGLRTVNLQAWGWKGLDVINAHERAPQRYVDGMTAAVGLVASGTLDPRPLFTHTFPLDRLGDALRMTSERPAGFMKALIAF